MHVGIAQSRWVFLGQLSLGTSLSLTVDEGVGGGEILLASS